MTKYVNAQLGTEITDADQRDLFADHHDEWNAPVWVGGKRYRAVDALQVLAPEQYRDEFTSWVEDKLDSGEWVGEGSLPVYQWRLTDERGNTAVVAATTEHKARYQGSLRSHMLFGWNGTWAVVRMGQVA